MEDHKILVGRSGRQYRFEFVADDDDRKPIAGIFAMVALQGGVLCSVIQLGETDNLPFLARAALGAAFHNYKATHALYRVIEDKQDRTQALADLIAAYNPIANRA